MPWTLGTTGPAAHRWLLSIHALIQHIYILLPHTAAWTCEESYLAPRLQNSAPHQCSCLLPFVSQWHQSLGTTLLLGLSLPGPSPASTHLCFQAIKLALLLRVTLSFPAKPQSIRVSAHSLGPDISSVASHNRENQSFVLPPNFYLIKGCSPEPANDRLWLTKVFPW